MNEHFDARWKRLVTSARRTPGPEARPPRPGWLEQVARRALLARTTGRIRPAEPGAWAGLVGLGAAATIAVLIWPGPVTSAADVLTSGAGALTRSVPPAPRLPRPPAAPRPPLPSRDAAVAALLRLPGLELGLPFPPHCIETP